MYIFFRFFFAIFLFPICFPVVFPRCVSPGGWVQVLGPAFLLTRARVKRARALAEKRLYGSKSSSQTWWTCHSLQIKVWFLLFYNVFFSLFSLLFSSIFNIFPIVFIIVVCFFSWFLSFFEKYIRTCDVHEIEVQDLSLNHRNDIQKIPVFQICLVEFGEVSRNIEISKKV
jgi:hypothetical protein